MKVMTDRPVATVPTACGIETLMPQRKRWRLSPLQQYLPLAVLKLNKFWILSWFVTMLQQYLPLAVLKLNIQPIKPLRCLLVATVPTACGMRRRVRGSRGVKRRWGPHISSPWPNGRENKGDEVTVLTACGIETYRFYWIPMGVEQLVATVPTACGIETLLCIAAPTRKIFMLQQHLPLAVLKRCYQETSFINCLGCYSAYRLRYWNMLM